LTHFRLIEFSKKMKNAIPALISILLTGALAASPLATESFNTDALAGGYTADENFDWYVSPLTNNRWVISGNSGFRAQIADNAFGWQSGTALVRPSDLGGLSHPLMPGSTHLGYALLKGENTQRTRQSRRQLGTQLSGDEFYFSGLLSMVNGLHDMRDGDRLLMGVSNLSSLVGLGNFDNGFFLGLHKDAGKVYLSAFADGQIIALGDPLTPSQALGTSMIVLRVQLGTGRNNDTLTAWYALNDDKQLTLGATIDGLNIAANVADLTHFSLMSQVTGTVTGFTEGTAFDEMRLGSSPSAVAVR
jgi:hypothetical protein